MNTCIYLGKLGINSDGNKFWALSGIEPGTFPTRVKDHNHCATLVLSSLGTLYRVTRTRIYLTYLLKVHENKLAILCIQE